METEVVSVIVPVYNAEKTIGKCVRSITGQTYRNLQIILVNDGSKDESLRICEELAGGDNRILLIDQPNAGVGAARNAGLEQLKGICYTFVDSDDYLHPEAIEKMRSCMIETSSDLVFCKVNHVVGDKIVPFDRGALKAGTLDLNEKNAYNDSLEGGIWSCLYKTSVFGKLRFHTKLRFGEDVLYFMDCFALKKKAYLLDERLYFYAYNEDFNKKYYREDFLNQWRTLGEEEAARMLKRGDEAAAAERRFHAYYMSVSELLKYGKLTATDKTEVKAFGKLADSKVGYQEFLEYWKTVYGKNLSAAKKFPIWLIYKKYYRLYRLLLKVNNLFR
ncbi:MAG: glycosyltransferase family 2 protein [Candidatus Gallimonas sp.]